MVAVYVVGDNVSQQFGPAPDAGDAGISSGQWLFRRFRFLAHFVGGRDGIHIREQIFEFLDG